MVEKGRIFQKKNLCHLYQKQGKRKRGIGEKIWMHLINLGQSCGKRSSRKLAARVVNSAHG